MLYIWNSINAGINQAQKDGYSASEILSLVKSKLGADHPWYQNIASSFDHKGVVLNGTTSIKYTKIEA